MSYLDLLSASTIKKIGEDLGSSVVVALQRKKKVVSGKTARSVRNELLTQSSDLLEIGSFGSEGMEFIIDGKRAGTKYPMKKVGDKFELVQALKDWKALVNFNGSDFLLARAIAENSRTGVDIPGDAADIFEERYLDDIQSSLYDAAIEEITNKIDKD